MFLELNIIQSVGIAVLFLTIGKWFVNRVKFLQKITIPAAVVGGLLFAIVNTIFYILDIGAIVLDTTLNEFFMVIYFTTIGFNASLKTIKDSGSIVVKFLLLTIGIIFIQNFVGIISANFLGVDPLLGLILGSPALLGGHSTVAAVSPTLQGLGLDSALTVGITGATLGITIGSITGGTVGSSIVRKNNLSPNVKNVDNQVVENADVAEELTSANESNLSYKGISHMIAVTFIAMFIGTFVTDAVNAIMANFVEGITFPVVLGPLLVAAIFRNISDAMDKPFIDTDNLQVVSSNSLDIFLSLTIVGLQLWTIFDVAIEMVVIVLLVALVTFIYSTGLVYRIMGKNYDAAIMTSGFIGFAMGSSSNAMASMRSVTRNYGPSPLAKLTVSIVAGLFADFINILIIYGFLAFLG